MNEEWRPVSGRDHYEASSFGRVRSIDRIVECKSRWGGHCKKKFKGRILSPSTMRTGYMRVMLGGKDCDLVHRLVAIAFLDRNGFNSINHKNGIKSDNRPKNLEWCSHRKNINHAIKSGLFKRDSKNGRFI